jgi:hypothetical protein
MTFFLDIQDINMIVITMLILVAIMATGCDFRRSKICNLPSIKSKVIWKKEMEQWNNRRN